MIHKFLFTGQSVIKSVCNFVLILSARPILGLLGEADYPTMVVPDLSITVSI